MFRDIEEMMRAMGYEGPLTVSLDTPGVKEVFREAQEACLKDFAEEDENLGRALKPGNAMLSAA